MAKDSASFDLSNPMHFDDGYFLARATIIAPEPVPKS